MLYSGKNIHLNFTIKSSFFNEIDCCTLGDFRKQFRHGGQSNTEIIITSRLHITNSHRTEKVVLNVKVI